MHTWALFSCSSLVTLTAFNLSQLPKAQSAGPQPEPDAGSDATADEKFSLGELSDRYTDHEPAVALPQLPDQPQMSIPDETIPGYNPALYDPALQVVDEVDLAAFLNEADLAFPAPDEIITYRAEAVQPLPASIPAPSSAPRPGWDALVATQGTATPPPVSTPQPESTQTHPAFARTPQSPVAATVATPAPGGPNAGAAPTAGADSATPIAHPDVQSTELFAALPEPTVAPAVAANRSVEPAPVTQAMAEQVSGEAVAVTAISPISTVSMELTVTRQQLIQRFCERSLAEGKPTSNLAVCAGVTNELAQSIPDAAIAGTPMPGMTASPTRNSPAMGVR